MILTKDMDNEICHMSIGAPIYEGDTMELEFHDGILKGKRIRVSNYEIVIEGLDK